jgi:ribosomal protein L7/L12
VIDRFLRWFASRRPRVPKQLAEPGDYRVILQVPGPTPVLVIREVRRATGRDLLAAKRLVDDWPAIVVEGLSEESAELVADRLRQVGAKALAAPIGENL